MSAIPYIHGPNFKVILNKMTELPIEIENDANCAALDECWKGAAMNENDLALIKNIYLGVVLDQHLQ